MAGMFEVMIERHFCSAHTLRGHTGKCANLHGHNYRIEIYARGSELNDIGLLVDFDDLHAAADSVVDFFDHKNINDLPPFDAAVNPSAENIARYIYEQMAAQVNDERVQISKVRCFETPTTPVTYWVE